MNATPHQKIMKRRHLNGYFHAAHADPSHPYPKLIMIRRHS
jgi:hypothetical protein